MIDVSSLFNENTKTVSGHCEIHGDYVCDVPMVDGEPRPAFCVTCMHDDIVAERKAEQIERDISMVDRLRAQRIAGLNIPPRMEGKTYLDYSPQTENAKAFLKTVKEFGDNWLENRKKGANLILCGMPGTGKTHLVSVLCRHIATVYNSQPLYTTASQMLRDVRSTYNKDSTRSEGQAIERFASVDLLVIDELGVKASSEHDKATLFEIIDERYQNVMPTIIVSNLAAKEIGPATDERIVDRLRENGTLMTFDWNSYR